MAGNSVKGSLRVMFTLVHKTSILVGCAPACTYVQIGGAFNGAFNGEFGVLRDFTKVNYLDLRQWQQEK